MLASRLSRSLPSFFNAHVPCHECVKDGDRRFATTSLKVFNRRAMSQDRFSGRWASSAFQPEPGRNVPKDISPAHSQNWRVSYNRIRRSTEREWTVYTVIIKHELFNYLSRYN
ncbi:hypothetical protein Plhal710r2_c005g0017921 [Plasmopara halstedii]